MERRGNQGRISTKRQVRFRSSQGDQRPRIVAISALQTMNHGVELEFGKLWWEVAPFVESKNQLTFDRQTDHVTVTIALYLRSRI